MCDRKSRCKLCAPDSASLPPGAGRIAFPAAAFSFPTPGTASWQGRRRPLFPAGPAGTLPPGVMPRIHRLTALTALALAASACTDRAESPLAPRGGTGDPPPPGSLLVAMDCRADVAAGTVQCAPAGQTDPRIAGDLIVGGQNVYVTLASSNVAYNSGTGRFTFDVTVANLIEQPMGTLDGTTADPTGVRVFFQTGPTVTSGSGSISVLPDGFGTFTDAGQPYYQYDEVLEQNEVSGARTWTLVMPPSVLTFAFTVFVSAPVEFPDGYITLDGALPGSDLGPLHPATPEQLTAQIKSVVGTVLPGTVTFGTSNPDCATVSPSGEVTGVRAATCTITATGGGKSGAVSFDVTGTTRSWTGALSSDWFTGGNWAGGYTPADVDSVTIPTGVPNFPALTASAAIGGVTVAGGATLSLGAFDLTASANVLTGATGGIGSTTGVLGLAGIGTVGGIVPRTRVTGRYSLAANVFSSAPLQVRGGLLRSTGFLARVR